MKIAQPPYDVRVSRRDTYFFLLLCMLKNDEKFEKFLFLFKIKIR